MHAPKRRRRASTRVRVAQSLALAGLVAALVGAVGPADAISSAHTWPGEALPAKTPRSMWYSPLLLSRHRPETLSATLPCSLPRALPDAVRPVTVLATARFPQRAGGLAITGMGDRMLIRVGDSTLGQLALASGAGDGNCAYRLVLGDGRWSVEGGPRQLERAGTLASMPVVTGFFSGLDLASAATPPSIEARTAVQAPSTTVIQAIAWMLAILCLLAALFLVAFERRPRPWEVTRRTLRGAARAAHPADLVVALVLLGWLLLGPAFWDDGWIVAKHRSFSTSGGFSTYYNSFGANAPLGYPLDWLQRFFAEGSSALVVQRLPALLSLAVTWLLCRWILARVLGRSGGEGRIALWALASTFLVGAMAWGMTLRPEPEVALLVTGIMACAVRFSERQTAAPLALAAVLFALAMTSHPAGLAGLAPLLVLAPSIVRWLRANIALAATIFAASAGLLMVSIFIGSDIEQRRADAQLVAATGQYGDPQLDELSRYDRLSEGTTATPLRRASVALMALVILAFLLRSRRRTDGLQTLPVASLGVALLLFIPSPSKLPWHFGALLGLAAVAVAVETARLRREAAEAKSWEARPFVALGAAVLAIAWCWTFRNPWNAFDLRTLDWNLGFESVIPLSRLAAALPFLLLGAVLLVGRKRRRSERWQIPWRVAAWTAPVLAVPLIVFTLGVLAADSARTGSWTLGRQNLGALRGDMGCGLADDLTVPVPSSALPLPPSSAGDARSVPGWAPQPPTNGLPHYALGPDTRTSGRTPWFRLPAGSGIGLYIAGSPTFGDLLELEWGRGGPGRIQPIDRSAISPAFTSYSRPVRPWRFVGSGELPEPPDGATAVRVALSNDAGLDTAIAVSAPFTYAGEPLAPRLGQSGSSTLILPNLATYFPCARLPRLEKGVAEVPDHIVAPAGDAVAAGSPLRYPATSPFAGVTDLYRLERLPLPDSHDASGGLSVFDVDRRIPGAELAPPSVVQVTP